MDYSPRLPKRRKLDTPKRTVSSPLVETSTRKSSGRLANRTKSYAHGTPAVSHFEGETARGRPLQSASNGTAAKRTAVQDIDIYDDIEGALSVEPSPRPNPQQLQATLRADTASSRGTDELQDDVPTKRTRKPSAKAKAQSEDAFRNMVKGYKHKLDAQGDMHDELATQASTPIKRAKPNRTPASSVRKTPEPRPTTQKQKDKIPEKYDDKTVKVQNGFGDALPSKLRSTKKTPGRPKKQSVFADEEATAAPPPPRSSKRQKSTEERIAIPETEDELSEHPLSSNRKSLAGTRRRLNRTDHISSYDDERWSEVETQDNAQDGDDMDVDGSSVVGSVLDPTEPSPFNKPPSAQRERSIPPTIYGNFAAGRDLDLLKTIVMERILGKRPSPLVGLDEEYKSVHQLVEQTITAGEGNSMLVIGARGSGKTALVNKVLSEVAKDNGGEYHVVRLNGFIHTDDKIALREIWRQLGKEMDVKEDGSGPGKNYADTLATLLALLSHPSEQTGEVTDQVAKAVVFIMDEFDLFAQHPRQTLLYNLFDIAQSRKAPIAVLGLTTRIGVTNSLEKRVKSRFSHRYVHLRLAKTFTEFQEISKACLLVRPEQLSVEERGILEGGTKATLAKKNKNFEVSLGVLAEWNANINKLFSTPSFLTTHLAPTFYLTKSIPTVLASFLLPVATLSPSTPLTPTSLLAPPDSKLSLIPHLSTLALSLLIAACRLDIIHDSDTANFNMCYDEYVTLASRARIQSAAGGLSSSSSASKVWGKDVAKREWEGLVDLGLVMPVVQGQAGGFGMVRCDVSLEEVGEVLKGIKGGDRGLERWCRSI